MIDAEERANQEQVPTERLLRVAASCPRCGARPALRITAAAAKAAESRPPTARMGTYQCQRRGCGTIYDLTAGAYQNST